MSELSHNDVMDVECPMDSPHKCYNGVCYGIYEFCSRSSRTKEPCINEDFLKNKDFRETVCQAIAKGKKETGVTIHHSCDMLSDCIKEFKDTIYIFKQGNYSCCETCYLG